MLLTKFASTIIKKSNKSFNNLKGILHQYRTPIVIYITCINIVFITTSFNAFKEIKQMPKSIKNDKKLNPLLYAPDYFSAYEIISNPLAII